MRKSWMALLILQMLYVPIGLLTAQNLNPRFDKEIRSVRAGDTLVFSSRVYLPSVVFISDDQSVDSCFIWVDSTFAFRNVCGDMSVEISYYTLPDTYLAPAELLNRDIIQASNKIPDNAMLQPVSLSQDGGLLEKDFAGVSRTGAISRAVRVGTNQSAVLNSTLDLQLSGYLPDSTLIKASITDNRIPVQPDGFSQQLRDIDRIFMEVSHRDRGRVTAGDYAIINSEHYFLNFDRRITGLGIGTKRKLNGDGSEISGSLNGAVSRGIFARNSFMGQEGNQGPYKLFGNNNELFIIIVSGSERVYLDGMLLTRGQEYDYVMDYNAGEITFTALRPITRERRIIIEFQYTTLLYLRTIGYAQAAYASKKFSAELVHYTESDSRNQTLFQDLNDDEKRIMAEAGSDFAQMRIPSAVAVAFSPDEILYEKVEQPGFGEIFVQSRDSTRQLYRVQFTFVGQGKGNYIQSGNRLNGRVFEWVAPVNGQLQGSYEPIKQLTPPQALRISSLLTTYEAGNLGAFGIQTAVSQKDINRFSPGDGQVNGYAFRADHALERRIGKVRLKTGAFFDWMQSGFTTVERVRQVEFQRDWALSDTAPTMSNQILSGVHMSLAADSGLSANVDISVLQQAEESRRKYSGNIVSNTKKILINSGFSYLTIQNPDMEGVFIRQKGEMGFWPVSSFLVGVRTDIEHNIRTSDHLPMDGSYSFAHAEPFIRFTKGNSRMLEVFGIIRTDDTVYNRALTNAAQSRGAGIKSEWRYKSHLDFGTSLMYREIQFNEITNQSDFAAYTGRIRLQQRWFRNSLIMSSFVETGTGTEPLRVFSYLEVPPGTGTHTWIDYNGNGIKELDEFEPARFPAEANYIRIFSPSSEFIRVEFSRISQSILFNPVSFAPKLTGWKKYMTRFSIQSTLQTDNRRQLFNPVNRIFHWPAPGSDTLTLGSLIQHRHSLFFDRTKSKFGWDANYLYNKTANLLAFGTEEAIRSEFPLNVRWKVIRPVLLRFSINYVEKDNISRNFPSRNFSIVEYLAVPRVEFQPNERYRTSFFYEYSDKKSDPVNAALLISHRLTSEHYLAAASKFAVTTSLQWVSNSFLGDANSPLGFAMLEGLQPGNNLIFNTQIQRNLANGLQISLTYEGRWSAQLPFIQSGVMQLKAFF